MLDRLRKTSGVDVIIHDEGLPGIKEVDAKLVRLAKILDCHIITNDFNLNKVAKLEGIKILNINDLSNALRPVLLPGDQMSIVIRREGKERNQGVGFLDDGTMIVVDNARRLLGRSVVVSVTSVLQTSAGRMIFANLNEKFENQTGQGREGGQGRERRPEQDRRPRQDRRPEQTRREPERQQHEQTPSQPSQERVQERRPEQNRPQEEPGKPEPVQHDPELQQPHVPDGDDQIE